MDDSIRALEYEMKENENHTTNNAPVVFSSSWVDSAGNRTGINSDPRACPSSACDAQAWSSSHDFLFPPPPPRWVLASSCFLQEEDSQDVSPLVFQNVALVRFEVSLDGGPHHCGDSPQWWASLREKAW